MGRWGNEGRLNCIHLWAPCDVRVVEKKAEAYPWKFGANVVTYKICINCRKVLS